MEQNNSTTEQKSDDQISLSKEAFNQRLQQAERSGVRKYLEEAGLNGETTAEQIKALLEHARGAAKASEGADQQRFQARIDALERHISSLEEEKQEEIARERRLREEIVVRESLNRAYLENNGITAEVSPHAQETALRDMLNMKDIRFVVGDDNAVSVLDAEGNPVYQDGQQITVHQWVRKYLEKRPYLVRSSSSGAGFGKLDKPLSSMNTADIRTSASDRRQRLAMGKTIS